MKKWSVMLVAFVMIAMVAGCTTGANPPGKEGDKSGKEKIVSLNNGNEPTSLDPPIGFDAISYNPLNNLMEGLTRLGKNNEPEAATAEKWEVSSDGKTYTFKIREDAKWSDGKPVTAQDFEYAWKRVADPKTASPAAFLSYFIQGAEEFNTGKGSAQDMKVKAKDDKTLEVTLNSPQKYFLSVISNPVFFPVPKETVEKNKDWAKEANTFVGNGPFKLAEWKHKDQMKMVKNNNYWDAKSVKLDGVVWKMIGDSNTEYQMFQTGELSTSGIPADLSEKLFKEGKAKVEDQSGTYFFRFNVKMKPFQNKNIRKAFSLAVNQEDIVNYVTKNKEKPAHGFVAYGFNDPAGGDFREIGGDLIKPDKEKAKELLQKGMKEEGYDKLPPVTLTYSTGDDTHKKIAEALQEMFKENLGVNVKLASLEANVFSTDQKALKLQFSRSSFLADYADPINFLESFVTDSPMNRTGWGNKEYDKLIASAKKEGDEKKRFEDMHKAEKILIDEAPIFPLYFYNQVYLQNENVTGIVRHPVGYLELKWADVK